MANTEFIKKEHVIAKIRECRDIANDPKNYLIAESPESLEGAEGAINYISDCVNDIPAADVRPERHGHWISREVGNFIPFVYHPPERYECSLCGYGTNDDAFRYCPYCGGKMDGGEENGG